MKGREGKNGACSAALTCVWLTVGISECSGIITNLSKMDKTAIGKDVTYYIKLFHELQHKNSKYKT